MKPIGIAGGSRSGLAPTKRGAFTLIEVLLALAIVAGAVAVLGEVARMGMQNLRAARDLTYAQFLADSTMSEILIGDLPTQSVSDTPFDTDPDWHYSIEVNSTDNTSLNLSVVTVTVAPAGNPKPGDKFSMTRWLVDPSTVSTTTNSNSTSSSSTTSGSSSSSGGSSSSTNSSGK